MAYAKVEFTNPENGRSYAAPVGLSWTTLFPELCDVRGRL